MRKDTTNLGIINKLDDLIGCLLLELTPRRGIDGRKRLNTKHFLQDITTNFFINDVHWSNDNSL